MSKRAFRLDDRRPFKRDYYRIVRGPELDPEPLGYSDEIEPGPGSKWTTIGAGLGLLILLSAGFAAWTVLEALKSVVK